MQFNTKEALSKTNEVMDIDIGYSLKKAKMATYTDNIYYFNFSEKTSVQQFKNFGETIRIKRFSDSLNWRIQDEYKEIQGYICQKATIDYTFNHLVENSISVWFAPDLPFQIGPIGITGVPGAILEFEKDGIYIYADRIKLYEKKLSITPPDKGRLMNSKAYQKMILENDPRAKKFMEDRKDSESK